LVQGFFVNASIAVVFVFIVDDIVAMIAFKSRISNYELMSLLKTLAVQENIRL
jgi:hypothetical protein